MTETEPKENLIKELLKADENKIDIAHENFKKGEYQKALNIFINSMTKENSAELLCLIGECHWQLGNKQQAIDSWKKVTSLGEPHYSSTAYTHIANSLFLEYKIYEALSNCIIATTFEPQAPLANYNLATTYAKTENKILSFKYYEKYLKYTKNKDSQQYKKIQNMIQNKKTKDFSIVKNALNTKDKSTIFSNYLSSIEIYPLQTNLYMSMASICKEKNDYINEQKYITKAYICSNFSTHYVLPMALSFENGLQLDYAYCCYKKYLNSILEGTNEYTSIQNKINSLKLIATDSFDLVKKHLAIATNEEKKANFEYALIEYENYKILADDKTDALADKIETLKLVINPEIYFIETNIKKLEMLMYNENYEDVIEICDKIILFSSQNDKNY